MESMIEPDWPLKQRVYAYSTTRHGGVSGAPFNSFNLAMHVGDKPENVARNRAQLPLADRTTWLNQVHGTRCLSVFGNTSQNQDADAAITTEKNRVCGVMTADCLPILLADKDATFVAAIHAGWRGLSLGIVENTLKKVESPRNEIFAWIGPGIGAQAFEVGDDVKARFADYSHAFVSSDTKGKYRVDLKLIAHEKLTANGIKHIYQDPSCTYSESSRFFSHRYISHHGLKTTGRMFTGIYIR